MTPERLAEIRAKYVHRHTANVSTAVSDIRELLAEVDRLQEDCPFDCGTCHAHENDWSS